MDAGPAFSGLTVPRRNRSGGPRGPPPGPRASRAAAVTASRNRSGGPRGPPPCSRRTAPSMLPTSRNRSGGPRGPPRVHQAGRGAPWLHRRNRSGGPRGPPQPLFFTRLSRHLQAGLRAPPPPEANAEGKRAPSKPSSLLQTSSFKEQSAACERERLSSHSFSARRRGRAFVSSGRSRGR